MCIELMTNIAKQMTTEKKSSRSNYYDTQFVI